jgi:hypothetical protein
MAPPATQAHAYGLDPTWLSHAFSACEQAERAIKAESMMIFPIIQAPVSF